MPDAKTFCFISFPKQSAGHEVLAAGAFFSDSSGAEFPAPEPRALLLAEQLH
jgi:hypothetical protein